jgi:hypothetical protein
MDSRLAEQAEQALVEAAQRLTPEQRLAAFVAHARLVDVLRRAGEQIRHSADSTAQRTSV